MVPFTSDDIPLPLRSWIAGNAKLTYPSQGATSDVALVDSDTEPLVLKRCRDPIYLGWLRREHTVLQALAETGLPIPRVLDYVEIEREGRPEVWLLMSHLEGRPLWNEILGATPRLRLDLLRRLGELLNRVHATPAPVAFAAESAWVDRQLAQAKHNLSWCDGTPDLLADLHRCRPTPVPEVLIHGDLALDNVLVGVDGTMSLIDWSGGDKGDPRCDFALALQTEPELTLLDQDVDEFFVGYGARPIEPEIRRWFVNLYEFF